MLHRCRLVEKCFMWQRKKAAPVRKENMHVLALFRFLAHSLTTFGRWGCGERNQLSHGGVGIDAGW
ncbi:hypothetical protein GW737_27050 [Escherichia coli]|nr:hypothetical protein [Escherichia coli]EFH6810789.1 hypothetical protein [Escherichia coli]